MVMLPQLGQAGASLTSVEGLAFVFVTVAVAVLLELCGVLLAGLAGARVEAPLPLDPFGDDDGESTNRAASI